jgi:hypothetical protein
MGGILLQAFLKENLFTPELIHGTVQHAERALALSTQWGVDVSTDNLKAASAADLILIGVKPFQVANLIAEIKPALTPAKTIVSFAASVKTSAIEEAAGMDIAVIRAMPNTPSALGAGAAALCRGRFVSNEKMELAQRIFETVGRTVVVDEKHMDAVTGLSGVYLHPHRGAGRGRRQGGAAARYGDATGGANRLWGGEDGAGDRVPSGTAEGRSDDAGRMYDRRYSGARRGRPARNADQSRDAGDGEGETTGGGVEAGTRGYFTYWVEVRGWLSQVSVELRKKGQFSGENGPLLP